MAPLHMQGQGVDFCTAYLQENLCEIQGYILLYQKREKRIMFFPEIIFQKSAFLSTIAKKKI